MKKIIILLLTLSLLILATACGTGENGSSSDISTVKSSVTVPEIITDKTEYKYGDSMSVNVNLPNGNTTECTLIAVPEYLSLNDNHRMSADTAFSQDKIVESTSVQINIDDAWFVGNYDLRLIANNQVVAKTTFSLSDSESAVGVPKDITFVNSYVPTEPENIYISKLKLSVTESDEKKQLSTAYQTAYEVRVRLDGGEWSESFTLDEKNVKVDEDNPDIHEITVFSLDKYKNGLEDNDNKVYNIFKNVINVMHTNPADYPNGRLYIDSTSHVIELQIRYGFFEDNHWSMPVVIGAY